MPVMCLWVVGARPQACGPAGQIVLQVWAEAPARDFVAAAQPAEARLPMPEQLLGPPHLKLWAERMEELRLPA